MKKLFGFLFLISFLGSLAFAGPWGIVVNSGQNNINTIDLGVNPPKIYGPFLTGELGIPGTALLDVAVTPDNNYALISCFVGSAVYRVDIKDPTHPVLAGKLATGSFFPEDIAISPNGQFAAISDGSGSNQICIVDLADFSKLNFYTLTTTYGFAQAVAIGNDNLTVILCDVERNRLIYGKVNSTLTGLVSENTVSTDARPLNVTVSPDGSTVLVASRFNGLISVFQMTPSGSLVPGPNPSIRVFDNPQSIDFSPDSKKAYVMSYNYPDAKLSWIQISGPGNASLGGINIASLFGPGNLYYGVDVLAVAPDGQYAIAGDNETSTANFAQLINLSNFQVSKVMTNEQAPTGMATFWGAVFPPQNFSISRETNNYIFYKEYINRLSWQAIANPLTPISNYRIYWKDQGAADSSYQLLIEVDDSTFNVDHRGLKKTNLYTYRITAVDSHGRESAPVEVSNVAAMRRAK
jgi:DNA-binding beta-propeller fold protein YncE